MPAYLLTGFHKTDRYSNEGGLKYFLLGSFASRHPAVRHQLDLRPDRHDSHRRDRAGAGRAEGGRAWRRWSRSPC